MPDGDGIPPGGDVAVLMLRRLMAVGASDLVDPFGRVIRDLRISVTDRCNFRCTYCMPEEGMTWLPRSEVLTFEEIERLARIFVERYGVDGIRLTGGEPTVRAHLPVLVAQAGRAVGRRRGDDHQRGDAARHRRRTCATPGCGASTSASTRSTGRSSSEMTRRDELANVLDGIEAAKEAGFDPVKINAVVERGVNDDEIVDLADVRPRPRRRGALHRVHAARRRRRTG